MTIHAGPARAVSIDDAIAAIRAYVRYRGWSIYRLAKEARLPRSGLRFFHEPEWNPNTATLRILYAIVPPDFDPSLVPPAPLNPKGTSWPEDAQGKSPKPTAM